LAHENLQKYLLELDKAAKDPTYAASVDGNSLSAEEASYLTVITEGITESFVCRMSNCHFFGRNDAHTWIKEIGRYHFKCPACGELYRPFTDYKSSVRFQYVIGLLDPESAETSYIPAKWPRSEEAGWLAKQVELHASQIESEADVINWHNKAKKKLSSLIAAQKIPKFFTQHQWRPNIEHRLSDKWSFKHIKDSYTSPKG